MKYCHLIILFFSIVYTENNGVSHEECIQNLRVYESHLEIVDLKEKISNIENIFTECYYERKGEQFCLNHTLEILSNYTERIQILEATTEELEQDYGDVFNPYTCRCDDPTSLPTLFPTNYPTVNPTQSPTQLPTQLPTNVPSKSPSHIPTTQTPSSSPSSNFPSRTPISISTTNDICDTQLSIATNDLDSCGSNLVNISNELLTCHENLEYKNDLLINGGNFQATNDTDTNDMKVNALTFFFICLSVILAVVTCILHIRASKILANAEFRTIRTAADGTIMDNRINTTHGGGAGDMTTTTIVEHGNVEMIVPDKKKSGTAGIIGLCFE